MPTDILPRRRMFERKILYATAVGGPKDGETLPVKDELIVPVPVSIDLPAVSAYPTTVQVPAPERVTYRPRRLTVTIAGGTTMFGMMVADGTPETEIREYLIREFTKAVRL